MNLWTGANKRQEPTIDRSMEIAKQVSIEQKVHEDVYSAQDLILKEADRIINEPFKHGGKKIEQLLELHELGFNMVKEVKDTKETIDAKKKHQKVSDFIKYYSAEYPLYRFIDEESVNNICNKYNLYLTYSNRYIAEIPDKNIEEIINFRVKRKDYREVSRGLMFHISPMYDMSTFNTKPQGDSIKGKDLMIIAPEHKLNTQGLTKIGRTLVKDDPIVLQPVNGGYLIVTSWGLEAADELIVNKINN